MEENAVSFLCLFVMAQTLFPETLLWTSLLGSLARMAAICLCLNPTLARRWKGLDWFSTIRIQPPLQHQAQRGGWRPAKKQEGKGEGWRQPVFPDAGVKEKIRCHHFLLSSWPLAHEQEMSVELSYSREGNSCPQMPSPEFLPSYPLTRVWWYMTEICISNCFEIY